MDITKILSELRTERAQLDEAIISLERMAAGQSRKRRGRPPAWLTAAKKENTQPKKRGQSVGITNKPKE